MARRVGSDRARGAGRRSSSRVAGQPAGGTRAGVIASRVLAVGAVFALTLGCSRSHEGLDAGRPVDASRDVSMPDAFCPDRDGDGFASAACGGQDCDDSRAELSPDATACVGATSFASCEGPEARTQPCPSEAPACDARTGRCSPLDAVCGDGVLHLGEECDDGNDLDEDGCTDCVLPPCDRSSECPPHLPYCVDLDEDMVFHCSPAVGAAPLGTRCEADSECESGWCDPEQVRCNEACVDHDDCDAPLAFCNRGSIFWPGTDFVPATVTCAFPCFHRSECLPDRECVFGGVPGTSGTTTRCATPVGPVPPGERSAGGYLECTSGYPGYDNYCSGVCEVASDCPASMPVCRPTIPPPEWGDRYAGSCQNPPPS